MLKLHNTLTRKVEDFKPIDPKNVRMYVCGITPYDHAHLGHARVYVVFDVLYRLLRHLYGENHVTYVRNFTDIDDKIIQRAAEKNVEPTALAQEFITDFHGDMQALGCLSPNHEPRVSDPQVMQGIASHIDALLAKDLAYTTPSGDVMFRSHRFPTFGQLAGRKLSEQQAGARVKVDEEKENAEDFVLWKANAKSTTKLTQAFSPAQLGAHHFTAEGRPGWHIECSVMSKQQLGDTFDIHGGGEDLQFPHHCCEIAQTESLTNQPMANVWLHNAFITVNGTKMSKSLGNFTTIQDVIAKYSPQAIRLWLLQTHYRKPVDFSEEALKACENRVQRWAREMAHTDYLPHGNKPSSQAFIDALSNDLNTPKALEVLEKTESLQEKIEILHFLEIVPRLVRGVSSAEELALLQERLQARTAKNWAESDRLRDELKALGILVEDHKDGTTTWRRA